MRREEGVQIIRLCVRDRMECASKVRAKYRVTDIVKIFHSVRKVQKRYRTRSVLAYLLHVLRQGKPQEIHISLADRKIFIICPLLFEQISDSNLVGVQR